MLHELCFQKSKSHGDFKVRGSPPFQNVTVCHPSPGSYQNIRWAFSCAFCVRALIIGVFDYLSLWATTPWSDSTSQVPDKSPTPTRPGRHVQAATHPSAQKASDSVPGAGARSLDGSSRFTRLRTSAAAAESAGEWEHQFPRAQNLRGSSA